MTNHLFWFWMHVIFMFTRWNFWNNRLARFVPSLVWIVGIKTRHSLKRRSFYAFVLYSQDEICSFLQQNGPLIFGMNSRECLMPGIHLLWELNIQLCLKASLLNGSLTKILSKYISSSSSRAGSTDIPDPLSPLLPIVHRPRQVFRTTTCILT